MVVKVSAKSASRMCIGRNMLEMQLSHDDDNDDDDDDYDGDDDDDDDDEDDDDGRAQHLEASAWSIVKLTQFNAIPWLLEGVFSYQFSSVSVTLE